MPFAGLGLHIVLALFCAVHVVRTGQQLYWLFILFAFPLLGSVVYFVAVYLPNSRLQRNAVRAVSAAAKAIDPQREVREARAEFEATPTAQNQMRLASALLEVGQAQDAAREYQACLAGPFASDPEIRLGAARAFVECQRYDEALVLLDRVRQDRSDYRTEVLSLLRARALAGLGRAAETRAEFESAAAQFGTFEVKAEYAIWAYAAGDATTGERLYAELEKIASRWSRATRELNDGSVRRLQAARKLAAG